MSESCVMTYINIQQSGPVCSIPLHGPVLKAKWACLISLMQFLWKTKTGLSASSLDNAHSLLSKQTHTADCGIVSLNESTVGG